MCLFVPLDKNCYVSPFLKILTCLCLHSQNVSNYVVQTTLSSTQPSSTTGDTQLGLGCAGPWHRPCIQFTLSCLVCTIYLLCPVFHRLSAAFSSISSRSLSVLADFPTVRGVVFPECGNFSSLLYSCQNCWFLF